MPSLSMLNFHYLPILSHEVEIKQRLQILYCHHVIAVLKPQASHQRLSIASICLLVSNQIPEDISSDVHESSADMRVNIQPRSGHCTEKGLRDNQPPPYCPMGGRPQTLARQKQTSAPNRWPFCQHCLQIPNPGSQATSGWVVYVSEKQIKVRQPEGPNLDQV